MTLGCKKIRNTEFVAKTQFLCNVEYELKKQDHQCLDKNKMFNIFVYFSFRHKK